VREKDQRIEKNSENSKNGLSSSESDFCYDFFVL